MSFDDSDQLPDYSFVEVMEYLVQKLESRYNSIIKFNKLIDSSNAPDTFFSLRKDFKLLFNDLEEDFRQGIFAIKALTSQNKKMAEDLKIKTKEKKNITDQLNNIVSENKNLKLQIIKPKDKDREQIKTDTSKNVKRDINNRDQYEKNEINLENETGNKKRNYSKKKNDKNEVQKEIEQFKKNNYEFEQLSNVKNIMDNMKKNKLKLKMAIEQHFTNNQDNDI